MATTKGKRMTITKEVVEKIQMLLSQNVNEKVIASVIGCSQKTVRRIRDGHHYSQRKPDEKAQQKYELEQTENAEQKPTSYHNELYSIYKVLRDIRFTLNAMAKDLGIKL